MVKCLEKSDAQLAIQDNGFRRHLQDPYIIHLNIALLMVVSLYSGVEKATCFKWRQNVSFQVEPLLVSSNHHLTTKDVHQEKETTMCKMAVF